jgi:hypothetical protein
MGHDCGHRGVDPPGQLLVILDHPGATSMMPTSLLQA